MSALQTIEGGTAAAVKMGAGLLTHWQALAFAGLALVSGLGIGALHFYDKGYNVASVKYEKAIAENNVKAKEDHDALQSKIDAAANTDNAALAAKLDALRTSFSQIKARYAPTKALPANCLFDDDRLRSANSALAQ